MSDTTQVQRKKRKTSKKKESRPFWNEKAAQLSQQWGLDVESPLAAPRKGEKIELNSWFTIVKHKQVPITNDSLDLPPKVDSEKKLTRARKIRLYPTTSQQETLRKWFGTQRYVYNRALKLHHEGQPMSIKTFRQMLINSDTNVLEPHEQWLKEYSYDLKDEALRDLVKNYSSNMARYKSTGTPFKLNFRSKKATTQSLSVLKKHWNKKRSFYCEIFSTSKMRSAEKLPEQLLMDSRLQRTRHNQYYLIVPMVGEEIARDEGREKFIFIDPGVRTFLTGYDSGQNVVEIGKNAVVRVEKLKHRRRKLQSKLAKLREHKKRQNHRKALHRLDEKISRIVSDMHKKSALFLCKSYENVFIPKLNFHQCSKLNRKSRSSMATIAHCSFNDRVVMKAEQLRGTSAFVVEEDYTSKTCSKCGNLKKDLGSNKIYSCLVCSSVFDRDFNAAKNIMLKYCCEHLMVSGASSVLLPPVERMGGSP